MLVITQPTLASNNSSTDEPTAFISNSNNTALRQTFTSETNCLGPTTKEPEWYHPLIKANRLDSSGIGYEGMTSENYVAFAGASSCRDTKLLLKAYREATPAGKLYIALCLQKLDVALANSLWKELKKLPPSKVCIIMNGCKLWADEPICKMASSFSKEKSWLDVPSEEQVTNLSRFFIKLTKEQLQNEQLHRQIKAHPVPPWYRTPTYNADEELKRTIRYAHFAVILNPNSVETHKLRAEVYKLLNNALLAQKDLEIAAKLAVKSPSN
jgi:hypothetical protein